MQPDGPPTSLHYETPLPLASYATAARPPVGHAIGVCSITGLCLLFGYYIGYDNIRLSHKHFGDFPTFYHAARAALDGRDMYKAYEAELCYVYPPLYAVCCTPLAGLSKLAAARIMLPINILCALAALLLGTRAQMRRFGVPISVTSVAAIALLAGLLSENELRNQLQALETDVLMLLAFTLGLLWLDRRPAFSGAALAFALNIKYLPIIVLPYLLFRRRWRAAAALGVWTIIWGLLPALVLGWHRNAECLHTALGGLMGWVGKAPPPPAGAQAAKVHGIADWLSISVTSAIARQLRYHGHPERFALVLAGLLGLMGMLLAWALYRWNRFPFWIWPKADAQRVWPFRGLVGLEWASLIVIALAFSPDTNPRHLVLALLVNVTASVLLLAPRPGVPRWPLAIGTGLMFLGFIMPLKGWVSPKFAHEYFRYGVASWGLLAMYVTLLWTALRYIRVAGAGREG